MRGFLACAAACFDQLSTNGRLTVRPEPVEGRRRSGAVQGFAALVLAGMIGAPVVVGADTRFIDYLHVEANEGGSSGGHVALRFGPETFHFQQENAGLIRLQRIDSKTFDFRYTMLGNRPIHETRIAVSEETFALLRGAFVDRLLVQAAQFDRLAALQADVALFQLWLARAQPDTAATLPVRAGAYFLPDGFSTGASAGGHSPILAALGDRLAAMRGETFITERIAALRGALSTWQPRAARSPGPRLARTAYPHFAPTASTQYREQLEGLTALEVLAAAPALRDDALRWSADAPPLDGDERRALERFAQQLSASLLDLATSSRSDFGSPLLVGMARLAAIERSLASGRLMVLDAFPTDAPAASVPAGAQREVYLAALASRLQPLMERARREVMGNGEFRESVYTQLETSANRLFEIERARRTGSAVRMERGVLLPARPAQRLELVAPLLSNDVVRTELAAARAAAADYYGHLAELYGYNLITRNCVSEVFATIDAALTEPASGAQSSGEESRRRLGGVVDSRYTLNFIPALSAAAVARNYSQVGQRTRPSYHQLRLAALAREDQAWRVALRESNTLTSTAYHPGRSDSPFLFFTDETVALRPLLGAANLLVGIADGSVGLVTWPADDGDRLFAGLRGALFSLPELAFVNIRKGSTAWVEPELLPLTRGAASPRWWSSSP